MGVHRCRMCEADSVINMRQHRLALCEVHFVEWVEKTTLRIISKHRMFEPDDRILVAVSGGKDSLSLWRILLKLGYQADGFYIDLGIDGGCGYSTKSAEHVGKFAQNISSGAKLHVLDLADAYGKTVPEMAGRRMGGGRKVCSVCGLVKRHEMNRVARELGYKVIATGHNLDDEAAVLFGNVLRWETEYIVRQSPVLPADDGLGLVKRAKPLTRFYERETAAYAIICNIDYILDECPFSVGAKSLRLKEVLNSMENSSPGTKMQFYSNFLRARENLFPDYKRPVLSPCEKCGQATAAPGLCAFCRLVNRD